VAASITVANTTSASPRPRHRRRCRLADLIADMQHSPAGGKAAQLLFNCAQAYLDTWQRAFAPH
jgi:hypothetical protein